MDVRFKDDFQTKFIDDKLLLHNLAIAIIFNVEIYDISAYLFNITTILFLASHDATTKLKSFIDPNF